MPFSLNSPKTLNAIELLMIVGACAVLAASLSSYLDIHIWQHDSAYYDLEGHFHKILTEGRWLNPYLVSILVKFEGRIILVLGLACLFGFFFVCSYRYTGQVSYAFVFATLCVQSPSITDNLMWPAVTTPALVILFLTPFVLRFLPVWLFYSIFGALFFSTLSNFYYLLPLAHLSFLDVEKRPKDSLMVFTKVILPWGFGFIVGYLIMKAAIFVFSYNAFGEGTTAINIAAWREPNPVTDLADIIQNTLKSLIALKLHLQIFFQNPWTILGVIAAVILKFSGADNWRNPAVWLVGLSMLLVHYVIVIPIGINIALRTVIATWVGLYVVLFLFTPASRKIKLGLMSLMLAVSLASYQDARSVLNSRHTISSIYYSDLLNSIPSEYQTYNKVIFLSNQDTYSKLNVKIANHHKLNKERMVWTDGLFGWSPMAFEAGFEEVILCDYKFRYDDICVEVQKIYPTNSANSNIKGTTIVEGIYQGNLVVRLNPNAVLN